MTKPVTSEAAQSARPRKPRQFVKNMFTAFAHRNYRLWVAGQLVSLTGGAIQQAALGYLVYDLTHSAGKLGIVGFATGLPVWLFTLYGGVIADRMSSRRILLVTQSARMVLVLILSWLVFTGLVQPWHVMALALGLGVTVAFNGPARQVFLREIVGDEDLPNAIAFNASLNNLTNIVGPALGGFLYVWVGPGWCFLLNGLSFLAIIAAMLLMHLAPTPKQPQQQSVWSDFKEGMRYLAGEREVLALIILAAIHSGLGIAIAILFPVWAVQVLGGNATTNGLLLSARGAGALFGALLLVSFGRAKLKGRLLTIGSLVYPLLMVGFAVTHWLPLALLVLVGLGWTAIWIQNLTTALAQVLVPEDLQGRVMSALIITTFGVGPLGALWIGVAADWFGSPTTIVVNAVVLLLTAACIWVAAPKVRALE